MTTKTIKPNRTKLILKKGRIFRLRVTLTPKNSRYKIIYKISNKKIVTVSITGKIKAIRKVKASNNTISIFKIKHLKNRVICCLILQASFNKIHTKKTPAHQTEVPSTILFSHQPVSFHKAFIPLPSAPLILLEICIFHLSFQRQ